MSTAWNPDTLTAQAVAAALGARALTGWAHLLHGRRAQARRGAELSDLNAQAAGRISHDAAVRSCPSCPVPRPPAA